MGRGSPAKLTTTEPVRPRDVAALGARGIRTLDPEPFALLWGAHVRFSAPEFSGLLYGTERCLRSWTGKQSPEPFSSPRRHSALAGSCQ